MKIVWMGVLAVDAFAASYLLFTYGPGFFEETPPPDPPGIVWIPGGTFRRVMWASVA